MNTKNKPQRRPDSAPEEHHAEGFDRSGLVHLAICLGVGVALVVAINLLGWLA